MESDVVVFHVLALGLDAVAVGLAQIDHGLDAAETHGMQADPPRLTAAVQTAPADGVKMRQPLLTEPDAAAGHYEHSQDDGNNVPHRTFASKAGYNPVLPGVFLSQGFLLSVKRYSF